MDHTKSERSVLEVASHPFIVNFADERQLIVLVQDSGFINVFNRTRDLEDGKSQLFVFTLFLLSVFLVTANFPG